MSTHRRLKLDQIVRVYFWTNPCTLEIRACKEPPPRGRVVLLRKSDRMAWVALDAKDVERHGIVARATIASMPSETARMLVLVSPQHTEFEHRKRCEDCKQWVEPPDRRRSIGGMLRCTSCFKRADVRRLWP